MRRVLAAVVISLLVHALLFLWLWGTQAPPAPPAAPGRTPLVFEVVERPAPPPPAATPPVRPAPPPRLATKPARPAGPSPEPDPPPAPSAPAAPPLASDVPRAPRALDLRPRLEWAPSPEGSAPRSSGRTLRPGDPSLSAEVQREEERARVQARLAAFGDEAFAAARARGGAPHPYLVELREALQQGLKEVGPRNPEALGFGKGLQPVLQQFRQNYQASAEEYGRTGTPGLAAPSAPTQGEKLKELKPDPYADFLRALVQAVETRESVLDRAPLLALSLELTQGRDGALLNAAIVESSGNRLFDSLVLQVAPAALGAAGAPPPDAFRREQLRSLWRVEGRLQLTQAQRSSLLGLLPDFNGLPTQEAIQHLRGEQPQLSYGARLLRYY